MGIRRQATNWEKNIAEDTSDKRCYPKYTKNSSPPPLKTQQEENKNLI